MFIVSNPFTVFRDRGYTMTDYPVAHDSYAREISLPIYPELDSTKIEYIVKSVVEAHRRLM